MRLMIAVIVSLIVSTTPGFAGQDDESHRGPGKGALIGGIVGLGVGLVASTIYTGGTSQCDSELHEHMFARCVLPVTGIVVGGSFAGHFIGRLADKPRKEQSSRTAAMHGWKPFTVAAPTVRLPQFKP